MKPSQQGSDANHPSFLALDRAHLGVPAREIRAHIEECEACRSYLRSLTAPDFVPNLATLQRAIEPPRRRFRWSGALAWTSVAAAAFSAFLFVSHQERHGPRTEDQYVGAKGFRSVWIYVQRGTTTELWDGRKPVASGDRVRLKIDAGSYHRVEVYSLSDPQNPTRLYQGPLSPGQTTTLPDAWEIDDSPAAEQLFVVFSDAPVSPTWDDWRQGKVQHGVAVLPFVLPKTSVDADAGPANP